MVSREDFRRNAMQLVVASLIVLFLELALIRWLASQIRVLAYFPNLILISAFLGLGLGSLRSSKASLLKKWPFLVLALVGFAYVLSGIAFTQESTSEHLWLLYYDLPEDSLVISDTRGPIFLFFFLSAACFAPLGQFIAQRLAWFRAHSKTLWGYCWDLSGSLVGVLAFAFISFLGLFPVAWFSIVFLLGIFLFWEHRKFLAVYFPLALATVFLVHTAEKAERYSPYYGLSKTQTKGGLGIQANGSLHQVAMPIQQVPDDDELKLSYHLPYRMLGRPVRKLLIVGAGSGNDVSVALAEGVEQIDAVEIDPVILEWGDFHPDQPYKSDRVRRINVDARSYLNNTDEKYDLIVFGTLDSMTRLSALSNVRLDNFVYTLECLQSANKALTEDGGVVMYFLVAAEYIETHLASILAKTFQEPPLIIARYNGLFNRIFLAGPAFKAHQKVSPSELKVFQETTIPSLEVPTDDWPYLYLAKPSISSYYLTVMFGIATLSAFIVFLASPGLRRDLTEGGADIEMFLYGLGFLLLETKCVTELNLVWGANWLSSAVVFASILAIVLAATILAEVKPLPFRLSFLGLVLALIAAFLIPLSTILGGGMIGKLVGSFVLVALPIFFAGLCFAARFKTRTSVDLAFGWNVLGAVAGGLLENLSMLLGLKALALVALGAYLFSFSLSGEGVKAGDSSSEQHS